MKTLIASCVSTILFCSFSQLAGAQVDESETGAWYMYLWNTSLENSNFGFQGDVQHRNWDLGGDLEQLLIRAGATWSPDNSNVTYTLGLAHITSGAYGRDSSKSRERRVYQEALVPQVLGSKVYLTHRFRLEQRDVDGQDFRNRFRYFVALNYPFNQNTLAQGAVYLSLYNELFVNLERDIGGGRRVDSFDRNRTYAALGYSLTDTIRLQFGYMHQETDNLGKGQLQFNLFHRF
ncbi:MAG: DUF2490 domain-containing protein [Gammaproteobacteria bacterium]|nr:DUF2490 domain-containing protein [Pseudomonadales bacterium]MCP5348115.1 DUF2490 domain-containing protein [Pseudomonadales bacterium]